METLGQRLRAARERAQLTQVDAAARAGIDNSSLSKVERNADRPSLRMLVALARAYSLPLDDILPPDHELRGVEIVVNNDERAWLQAFRGLPPDDRAVLLRTLLRPPPR